MPKHLILLLAAVVAETVGTSAMQASQQFSKLVPSVVMIVSYAIALYLLAQTLRYMPVGVVYAIWSGLGIVFIAIIGRVWFGQKLDPAALVGIALILAGVLVINLWSKTATH